MQNSQRIDFKKKGKLIVIDGTDGCGKATQAKLLVESLKNKGVKVETLDFPRYYDNMMGKLIGECLAGKHGNFAQMDPKIASVLYAVDRFESKKHIEKWLNSGSHVILDRYVSANQIHQAGKYGEEKDRKEFVSWIERVEYDIFELPKPDIVFYIDMPVKLSQSLVLKDKNQNSKKYLKGEKDQHESDGEHLTNARKAGLAMLENNNKWQLIEAADKDGEIKSVEEVQFEIRKMLSKFINI